MIMTKPLHAALIALSALPVTAAAAQDRDSSATILPGKEQQPTPAPAPRPRIVDGDITLNFPSASIRVVAASVLGDILHVPYSVSVGIDTPVTVVTTRPIARQSVLAFFEEAIRRSDLALVTQDGRFTIEPITSARGAAPTGPDASGFANEIVRLEFVGADQMKALLDPILPGVVVQADTAQNSVTLSGTSGQRASARDLLRQFDVNWLRAMSFGLYIPRNTDARLIAPELEKLLNAPDAPTKGLVRLIAMEKLNGIVAISRQPQYLGDVQRWVEILDREGQSSQAKLFVYRVQNGRSRDLARTINAAFGNATGGGASAVDPSGYEGNPDGNRTRVAGNGGAAPVPAARGDGIDPAAAQRNNTLPPLNDQPVTSSGGGAIPAIITSDDNNNAIIVFGTPRVYALIEAALRQLDVPPVQVLIEAAITEVSLTDDLRYGVQWNFTSGNTDTVLTDSTATTNLVRQVPGFSFLFANTGLNAVLNTLATKTKINVVSAPKLLVLNNQTAVLQVGDQVPVLTQSSTSTISGNAPVINAIEYRDTGVILKVTPRVNATGVVLLDVSQEVSDVNVSRTAGSGVASPTISTRKINTSVAVKDGEVLALGGLIRNTESRDKIGFPFLSQIPIIGGLFGRQAKNVDRTELIVILRPRVVRSVEDGRAVTDELRRKIRSLEPFASTGQIP